jgi:ribosome-associated translation inhibitor RaiA
MRVVVSTFGEALNQQIRSYAEYRIFSALSTHDDVVGARVNLHAAGDEVQCSVRVTLNSRSAIEARTSASYAAAAIDRAAERLAALIGARRSALST